MDQFDKVTKAHIAYLTGLADVFSRYFSDSNKPIPPKTEDLGGLFDEKPAPDAVALEKTYLSDLLAQSEQYRQIPPEQIVAVAYGFKTFLCESVGNIFYTSTGLEEATGSMSSVYDVLLKKLENPWQEVLGEILTDKEYTEAPEGLKSFFDVYRDVKPEFVNLGGHEDGIVRLLVLLINDRTANSYLEQTDLI